MCMTRKRHGLPPSHVFFEAVCRKALQTNYGNLFMGYHAGNPSPEPFSSTFENPSFTNSALRTTAFTISGPTITSCGQPSNTTSIRSRHDRFGRTEFGHHGLRQYKRGWGAQEMLLFYYRYDVRRRAFLKEKKAEAPPATPSFENFPFRSCAP